VVDDPVPLRDSLAMVTAGTKLLMAETEQENSLWKQLTSVPVDQLASVALAIGPEGGWAPEEMQLFAANGWKPVTLGPRILRAETAAIAALAVCGAVLS